MLQADRVSAMAEHLSEVVSTSYEIFLQKVKVFSSTWAFLFAALEAPPVPLLEMHQACCHHSYVRTVPGQVRCLRNWSVSSISTPVPTDTMSKEEWWQTRFYVTLPKHIKLILVSLEVTSSLKPIH